MNMNTLPSQSQETHSVGARASRGYLLACGSFLLVTGIVGFMLDTSFPTRPAEVSASHGHIFGVLETNGWHNLAAVGIGLPSLAVALRAARLAAPFAFTAGALNLGVFILFALFGPEAFLFASNSGDQVLHAVLAVGGLGFGAWGLSGRTTQSIDAPGIAPR